MYKRIIEELADKKVAEITKERQQKKQQDIITKTKYKLDDVYVAYVVRQIQQTQLNGKNKVIQMINGNLILCRYISKDCLQDLETLKRYPLLKEGTKPNEDICYIPERSLEKLTIEYIDVLDKCGVADDELLTIKQLRTIVTKQQINQNIF